MDNPNDYVTKKDLQEGLEKVVEDLSAVIRDGFSLAATKKDLEHVEKNLEQVEARMATKKDLEKLASKEELKSLEIRMNERFDELPTKEDLHALEKKLLEDSAAIAAVHDKEHRALERRVERLEKHAGIPPRL